MSTINQGYPVNGYFQSPGPVAGQGPTPVAVTVNPYQAASSTAVAPMAPDYTALSAQYGPILPLKAGQVADIAAKTVPSGTMAAVGAAQAIANNSGRAMQTSVGRIVAEAGEPLLKLSWSLLADTAGIIGNIVKFDLKGAVTGIGTLFKNGAVNTGGLVKKLFQPVSLTSATAGGTRAGLAQAVGAGLSTGLKALKSSFIWAIPASALNAFIDYKYKDQTDPKRLATNFGADVIGYTATGMASAAIGAAVGSMTVPIVGTLVGAGVGIVLGMAHDKMSRPIISDFLRDQMG